MYTCVVTDWTDNVLGVVNISAKDSDEAALRAFDRYNRRNKAKSDTTNKAVVIDQGMSTGPLTYTVHERQVPDRDKWPVKQVDR